MIIDDEYQTEPYHLKQAAQYAPILFDNPRRNLAVHSMVSIKFLSILVSPITWHAFSESKDS